MTGLFLSLFDLLLAGLLLALAFTALAVRDRFQGVILFMLFGLLMALAWVRVEAPDLALAEAAIGAGISGALFLGSLGRAPREGGGPGASARLARGRALAGCLGLGLLLSRVVLQVWPVTAGLGEPVYAGLKQSGVGNPVTAVILNFRSYDTLLEIGVLLVAVLGVFGVTRSDRRRWRPRSSSPVLEAFLRILVPFGLLTAVYLVWVGAQAPGGAFQSGALLGGLAIVLLLGGRRVPLDPAAGGRRGLLAAGFLLFLLAALLPLFGGRLLEYPAGQEKTWMILIELACTLSIAATLAALFAGVAGYGPSPGPSGKETP